MSKIMVWMMLSTIMLMIGHSIIVHYHHLDSLSSQQNSGLSFIDYSDCCSDETDIAHCHLLNDTDTKFTSQHIEDSLITLENNFIQTIVFVLSTLNAEDIIEEYFCNNSIILPKHYFLSLFSFRGPPSIS